MLSCSDRAAGEVVTIVRGSGWHPYRNKGCRMAVNLLFSLSFSFFQLRFDFFCAWAGFRSWSSGVCRVSPGPGRGCAVAEPPPGGSPGSATAPAGCDVTAAGSSPPPTFPDLTPPLLLPSWAIWALDSDLAWDMFTAREYYLFQAGVFVQHQVMNAKLYILDNTAI